MIIKLILLGALVVWLSRIIEATRAGEMIKSNFRAAFCMLFHNRYHFDVGAGFRLCAVCDAHLLDELIKTDAKEDRAHMAVLELENDPR
jgi:hypothetical protein